MIIMVDQGEAETESLSLPNNHFLFPGSRGKKNKHLSFQDCAFSRW